MTKKLTFATIKAVVENKGITLLSDYYNGYSEPLEIICENGHRCVTTFGGIKCNQYCKECGKKKISKRLSFSYEYVKQHIESKNITLISKEYSNNYTNLDLECNKCNRIWSATFANISRERGCPTCAGRERLTYKYVRDKIEMAGMELISKEYINAKTPLKIKCVCGNTTEKTFDCFVSSPLCRECGNKKASRARAYTIDEVREEISNKNGKLLSLDYKNNSQKLKVLCLMCNIIFRPTLKSIKNLHWCPNCCRPGATMQRKLFGIIASFYPKYEIIYNYTASWLGRQHIDIFVKSLGLAIEYDGAQHFMPVCFGGMSKTKAENNFTATKERDMRKNKIIKASNEVNYFIRFSYNNKIDKKTVSNALINLGCLLGERT